MTRSFGLQNDDAGSMRIGSEIHTNYQAERAKDLALYDVLSAATNAMVTVIDDRHTGCPQKHTTYVILNSYCGPDDEVMIETMVTAREQHKSPSWRSIH